MGADQSLLKHAREAEKANNYKVALQFYSDYLKSMPEKDQKEATTHVPDIYRTMGDLALKLDKPTTAFQSYSEALIGYIRACQKTTYMELIHSLTLLIENNLQIDDIFRTRALSILENMKSDSDHLSLDFKGGFYRNLATVARLARQFNCSNTIFRQTIEAYEASSFQNKYQEIATYYNTMGYNYTDVEDYKGAQQYHEKAMIIREQYYGKAHLINLVSYMNLRNHFKKVGDVEMEAYYWSNGLRLIDKQFHKKEKSDSNMISRDQALKVLESHYSDDEIDIFGTLEELDKVLPQDLAENDRSNDARDVKNYNPENDTKVDRDCILGSQVQSQNSNSNSNSSSLQGFGKIALLAGVVAFAFMAKKK